MSNGNKRNRTGGGNQQRRRRSGGGNRPQAPTGPTMTALGESTYEAVFDHGGNGYGVWFDGVVRDDPMYKQFWKGTGTRPLYVRIEEDRIVLLKELNQDAVGLAAQTTDNTELASADQLDENVDAAIEEAVAEAMAAAEAAAADVEVGDADAGEKVYSPEEAAALFAAETVDAEAGDAEAGDAGEPAEEAPAKPKRRAATRRKPAAKKTVADSDDE